MGKLSEHARLLCNLANTKRACSERDARYFRGEFKNKNKVWKKMGSFLVRTVCVLLLSANFFFFCKNVFSMDPCKICGRKKQHSDEFFNITLYRQYIEPCFGVEVTEGKICSCCVRATNHYKKSGKTFYHVSKSKKLRFVFFLHWLKFKNRVSPSFLYSLLVRRQRERKDDPESVLKQLKAHKRAQKSSIRIQFRK